MIQESSRKLRASKIIKDSQNEMKDHSSKVRLDSSDNENSPNKLNDPRESINSPVPCELATSNGKIQSKNLLLVIKEMQNTINGLSTEMNKIKSGRFILSDVEELEIKLLKEF